MQAAISVLAAASGWLFGGSSTCVCECRHEKDLVGLLGQQLDRSFDLRATGATPSPTRSCLTAFLLGVAVTVLAVLGPARSGWVSIGSIVEVLGVPAVPAGGAPVADQRPAAETTVAPRIGTPGSLRAIGSGAAA